MNDVRDLQPAIAAACDALVLMEARPPLAEQEAHRYAEVAVRAAAATLSITDLAALPHGRVREPQPQRTGQVVTHPIIARWTLTVDPRGEAPTETTEGKGDRL